MITIYPIVATINAGTKPYSVDFYAELDFEPGFFVWYIDGRARYSSNDWGAGPPGYAIDGPTMSIPSAATVVRLDVYRKIGGTLETVTYTTAEQRAASSLTVTLTAQLDGKEIVHGVSVPDTPVLTPVAGTNELDITWSPIATGQDASSRVWIRVAAADQTGSISRLTVNWGDGDIDTHDYDDLRDIILDTSHEYVNTTGSKSIVAYHTTAGGDTPGPTGTLGVSITADATGWFAHQYEITKYRSQIGFMHTTPVGWRDIEDGDRDVELYDVNRVNIYYCRLRLREVDYTGRPIRVSAYSAVVSAGPWA